MADQGELMAREAARRLNANLIADSMSAEQLASAIRDASKHLNTLLRSAAKAGLHVTGELDSIDQMLVGHDIVPIPQLNLHIMKEL